MRSGGEDGHAEAQQQHPAARGGDSVNTQYCHRLPQKRGFAAQRSAHLRSFGPPSRCPGMVPLVRTETHFKSTVSLVETRHCMSARTLMSRSRPSNVNKPDHRVRACDPPGNNFILYPPPKKNCSREVRAEQLERLLDFHEWSICH